MELFGLAIIAVIVLLVSLLVLLPSHRPDAQPQEKDNALAARYVQIEHDNSEDRIGSHRNYWRH